MVERPARLNLAPALQIISGSGLRIDPFWLGRGAFGGGGNRRQPLDGFGRGGRQTAGLSLGITTFLISLSVLILWVPLRQTPGLGTLLNALIVAFMLDFSLPYLPRSEDFLPQIFLALLGVFTTGLGGAIYLIANLGPGPRDGLMTGLQALSGRPLALVRSALEMTVVLAGFALGGTLGLGTLFFAFGIGPAIAFCLSVLSHLFRQRK